MGTLRAYLAATSALRFAQRDGISWPQIQAVHGMCQPISGSGSYCMQRVCGICTLLWHLYSSVAFVLFCGICTHVVNVMSCCVPLPYRAM